MAETDLPAGTPEPPVSPVPQPPAVLCEALRNLQAAGRVLQEVADAWERGTQFLDEAKKDPRLQGNHASWTSSDGTIVLVLSTQNNIVEFYRTLDEAVLLREFLNATIPHPAAARQARQLAALPALLDAARAVLGVAPASTGAVIPRLSADEDWRPRSQVVCSLNEAMGQLRDAAIRAEQTCET